MTTIEFTTSAHRYRSKVVAEVTFPVMARLGVETVDGRKLLGPRNGKISVRLPAPIMTDYDRGPLRPNVPQITKYRMIGALLAVTIGDDSVTGHGVLYKHLPPDVEFWPGIDVDKSIVKGYKNGRLDIRDWQLVGVTLRDRGPVWADLPTVTITRLG